MMEFIIIVLIVVVWIILGNKMSRIISDMEILKKESIRLRKSLTQVPEKTQEPITQQTEPAIAKPKEDILEKPATPLIPVKAPVEKVISQPKPVVPVLPREPKLRKQVNYEKYIGENLFGKIGILILVIGMGLFVKYAIDNEWINETLRTILGFAVGGVLLFFAQRLHQKYRTFSSLLAGGAFAIFYVTVAIAYHYYHLFSQSVAFILLIVITILMSGVAIIYNRRELAIISLTGGFLAPFLVSSGEGNYIVLFTYIAVLNVGMFMLSIYKKWAELPILSFAFSWLIMTVYTLSAAIVPHNALHLLLFATFFYLIFLLPIISVIRSSSSKTTRFLLSTIVINNFVYLAFGLFFLNHTGILYKLDGILSLFVAIVNLILILWLKIKQIDYKLLIHALLGVIITFVSITVPLQLEGNHITLFWASETVLLLWLFSRSETRIYKYFSAIMLLFTFVSYCMDISQSADFVPERIFLNSHFATNIFVAGAMGVYAFILKQNKTLFTTTRLITYIPMSAIAIIASCLTGYYAFMFEFYQHIADMATSSNARYLFTAVTILLLGYGLKKRFPIAGYMYVYLTGMGLDAYLYLNAYLTIGATWTSLLPGCLSWLFLAAIVTNMVYISRQYYRIHDYHLKSTNGFMVYLNILSTVLVIIATASLVDQIQLDEFSAGFSIALTLTGFIQMTLGMKLHIKVLRIISLFTFGIVLGKLLLFDLWLLPTVGKIIVFIVLGIILLVLSFLYQKLKNVLFK